MNNLCAEIISKFPEINSRISSGDENLHHLIMNHAADWVKENYNIDNNKEIVSRIIDLQHWCMDQDDNNESFTVFMVSFFETVCEFKGTHSLVPMISEKESFLRNEDYLVSNIGRSNYENIIKLWDEMV